MPSAFEELLTGLDGEQVAVRYDAELATWMFIGVHSTTLGSAGGGTRMRVYERPEDALADVLALSSAMTRKFAACDVPRGGGKAVLAVPALPEGEARRELLHRFGDFVSLARRPVLVRPGHEHVRARHGRDRRALPVRGLPHGRQRRLRLDLARDRARRLLRHRGERPVRLGS